MFWIQFEFWTKALFNMIFTVGLAKFFTILGLIYALHTDSVLVHVIAYVYIVIWIAAEIIGIVVISKTKKDKPLGTIKQHNEIQR